MSEGLDIGMALAVVVVILHLIILLYSYHLLGSSHKHLKQTTAILNQCPKGRVRSIVCHDGNEKIKIMKDCPN